MTIFQNNTQQHEDKFFAIIGHEDYLDADGSPRVNDASSPKVAAKMVFSKKSKHFSSNKSYARYYIKIDPNDNLFNPRKIHSSITDKKNFNFINEVCKDSWIFKEVTPQIFNKYITFLKTHNLAWLKEAQRDLI